MEPFRDIRWADVPPITVTCWMNIGLRESTAQLFGELCAGQKQMDSDTEKAMKKESAGTQVCDDDGILRPLRIFVADLYLTEGTSSDVAAKGGDIIGRLVERTRLLAEKNENFGKAMEGMQI